MKEKPSINFLPFLLVLFTIQTAELTFFTTELSAQNRQISYPRIEPDPKALDFYNIISGNSDLSWTELGELSLWSSGDTSLANLQKIRDAVSSLNNSDLPSSAREKAEYILGFMHTNFLRTYSIYQTRLDTLFTNGRFNCVSSAVLYTILCKSAGIRTSGVVTREHAFVIVHINDQNIDVETTNRYGFDPGNRKEFHDQFGRLTGFSYVPAHNYRDRQTISQAELVSLILHNRIAEHERTSRYNEAVPLASDRAALLMGNFFVNNNFESGNAIFENPVIELIERMVNYGASLLRSNREEEALKWAASAPSNFASFARWQEFIYAAANNRIARFVREKKPAEARTFLENNKTLFLDQIYSQLDSSVVDAELLYRANNIRNAAEGDSVVNDINQARRNSKLPENRGEELLIFAIQKTASVISAAPDMNWRDAISYLENAISLYGKNSELEKNIQVFRSNLASYYHNRFAAEWNKRNIEEAQRILNEALAEFPDNRLLLSDLEIVNKYHSQ